MPTVPDGLFYVEPGNNLMIRLSAFLCSSPDKLFTLLANISESKDCRGGLYCCSAFCECLLVLDDVSIGERCCQHELLDILRYKFLH